MKKIKFTILGIALLVGLFVACSDDFLDVAPQASLDEGTLGNQQGVEATLISAYSMLDGWNDDWGSFGIPWGAAGSNWIWGSVPSDEAYKGSEPGDQLEIQLVELFQWAPGNGYLNFKFLALYEGIARSNATIKLMKKSEGITDQERIEAEARFFERALSL
ncbi:MAG: hypothetical protein IPO07_28400 [Haliscomenobacter sp.]|nr:hypothetical protein [Haliscomenobacter sp.]MBK9492270.1 hypothetical protein [Haliscomenobacter sp.]